MKSDTLQTRADQKIKVLTGQKEDLTGALEVVHLKGSY